MAEIYKIGSNDLIDRVSTFGGTNLLVDTWLATNQYGLSNCTASIVADASAPIKSVVRLTLTDSTKNAHCYLTNMKTRVPMQQGEQYVASAWLKSSANMNRPSNIMCECYSGTYTRLNNVNISTSWSRQSVVFTYNENATYQALYIIYPELWSGLSNGGYIDIGGIKIEKGNKPTEWTPAPQDLVTVDTTNNTLVFFQ
jgi:hypothetical protein